MAPEIGFEPTTLWLTATCSTAELLRNINVTAIFYQINIRLSINFAKKIKIKQTFIENAFKVES